MRFPNLIAEPSTAAELFMSRYRWLARWAMQFARNDRAVAEDLIQETFLRFSQANVQVGEIRDPEALLYTYLEHVHLAHMREVTRHTFVSLADAKLDALALGLLTGPDVDRIETQNLLRRIAVYVTWRKQTSKSASIVALRFFHGYLPEEIARIGLMSREAVDERLHNGRSEIRLHLLDSAKLRQIQHGGPAEVFPSKVVVPTDAFLQELRKQLFQASHGVCISAEQLALRYRKGADVPIRRDLLSHLVSCPKCLAIVERVSRTPRHPHGSDGDGSTGMERFGPNAERLLSSAKELEGLAQRAERRMKEIFEHRPTSLIVAVNGEILASRDIRASFNGLKVEVMTRDLKFIEILSEYGVSLLSWGLESTPPHSDPVLHRAAEFSLGRRLGVDLQFSAQKLVIEVQYSDPSYKEDTAPSFALVDGISNEEDVAEAEIVGAVDSRATALGRNLRNTLRTFRLSPLIAAGLACALIFAVIFISGLQRFSRVKPAEFLQRASATEKFEVQSAKSSVILQQVSVRSKQGAFERSIYRDPEGKRHMKEPALDEKSMRLKKRLADAGIDWDAPLSPTSFREWQAHTHVKAESVHSIDNKLLSLRVETEGSDVEQETLTIRVSDSHPIGITAEFRDLGTVEIAELNYAVVPWATVNQDLFESDGNGSGAFPIEQRTLHLPQPRRPLSDVELDLSELEVRTALREDRADSTDRLTLSRTAIGVEVNGLVEDERQKIDLQTRLHRIPHVSTNLKTVTDASERPDGTMQPASIQVASVVAEPSLLDDFLLKQGRNRETASIVADRLFAASSRLLRASKAMLGLRERFPPGRLAPEALDLYNRLLASWYGELDNALAEEWAAIQQTEIQISPDQTAKFGQIDLNAGIEENRALMKELIGHDSQGTRTAPVILAELAQSVESLHRTVEEQHEKVAQSTSANAPSAQNTHP